MQPAEYWIEHLRLKPHPEGGSGVISHKLGLNLDDGDQPQLSVPANHWFGAMLDKGSYALVSCTVAPGFDFTDFEMGRRDQLLSQFPGNETLITRLTPG